jgi:hypothetical protein
MNNTEKRKLQFREASKRFYKKKKENYETLKIAFTTSFIINIILIVFNTL